MELRIWVYNEALWYLCKLYLASSIYQISSVTPIFFVRVLLLLLLLLLLILIKSPIPGFSDQFKKLLKIQIKFYSHD